MSLHYEKPARRGAPRIAKLGETTDNAAANRKAWKQMTEAERLTGRPVEALEAVQAELREAFYRRIAA